MYMNIISKEAYLRFFIYAFVFILCQKMGNFLDFFGTLFSTFHKKKLWLNQNYEICFPREGPHLYTPKNSLTHVEY